MRAQPHRQRNAYTRLANSSSAFHPAAQRVSRQILRHMRLPVSEAAINGVLSTKILQKFSRLSDARDKLEEIEPLSERESKVLELLVHGKDNKEIALALSIALSMVKTYLQYEMENPTSRT